MPRNANFIFEVQIRIPEAFTLDSIVRSPRTFKPKDVASACQNNELVLKQGEAPYPVVDVATYVMTDFFAMAHGTGLYNRQRQLWESLSQVNSIHVNQLTSGLFHKAALPIFDFSFRDYKGKPLLLAFLVAELGEKQKALSLLRSFLGRAQGKSSLTGVLAFFPKPMPPEVLEYVRKQTHSEDAIARYEAIMPSLKVPFDLLEMDRQSLTEMSMENGESTQQLHTVFALQHPDIKSKQEIKEPTKVMRKVMPKPKEAPSAAEPETNSTAGES